MIPNRDQVAAILLSAFVEKTTEHIHSWHEGQKFAIYDDRKKQSINGRVGIKRPGASRQMNVPFQAVVCLKIMVLNLISHILIIVKMLIQANRIELQTDNGISTDSITYIFHFASCQYSIFK